MEVHKTQVSFFGRLADDLTRNVITPPDMDVSLDGDGRTALCKRDGYFVFSDLPPSPPDYRIRLGARSFQYRTVTQTLPAGRAVPLNGNDELYVSVASIPPAAQGTSPQVTFEKIAFVPSIEIGAAVLGAGFSGHLAAPLEGTDVGAATLDKVDGLVVNQPLRVVRSTNLLVRPDPYYSFPGDATVVVLHVVANDGTSTPLAGAAIEIGKINGNAAVTAAVQGVNLNVFGLGGSSSILLDDDGKKTSANERGDAVFYFPGAKAITAIEINVSKPQYQPLTQSVNIKAGARNAQTIALAKV